VGEATGEIAIADDSGLCILALDNQPGVYSANWIESLGLQGAIAKILEFLKDKANKQAKFVSTICVYYPKTKTHEFFIGEINGVITSVPKGNNGFGYDPIFLPEGFDKTFGEMNPEEKNAISHRTIALNKCIDKLLKELI
jgi:XTP/dITP diphosphohydrolase